MLDRPLQIGVTSWLTQPSTLNIDCFSTGANLTTTRIVFQTGANLTSTRIVFLRVPTSPQTFTIEYSGVYNSQIFLLLVSNTTKNLRDSKQY